jgi:hypothetical protein
MHGGKVLDILCEQGYLETGEFYVMEKWIAIATYVSIALVKKRLNLKHSLCSILRVLDLNMFEMTPIEALLGNTIEPTELSDYPVQQELF